MDYFNRLCYTENMNEEERLLKFLSSKSEKELKVNSEGDAFMEQIKEDVQRLNLSEKTLDELYVEGEEQRIRNTERKIGREEGLEQGTRQGIEQGQKEKGIEIAKYNIPISMDI